MKFIILLALACAVSACISDLVAQLDVITANITNVKLDIDAFVIGGSAGLMQVLVTIFASFSRDYFSNL